ncbi:MAG: amidohydrolase family protein, partial [Jatrophihabitantaceae bacterium]
MKFHADYALLPGGLARDVGFVVDDGRFAAITVGEPAPDARRLPGLVLPGFANAHSHAFHRALRGRTHDRGGTFWTWRERMYAVAARLDPDSYLELARATYAEMALAGVTAVGEFHYLHHG